MGDLLRWDFEELEPPAGSTAESSDAKEPENEYSLNDSQCDGVNTLASSTAAVAHRKHVSYRATAAEAAESKFSLRVDNSLIALPPKRAQHRDFSQLAGADSESSHESLQSRPPPSFVATQKQEPLPSPGNAFRYEIPSPDQGAHPYSHKVRRRPQTYGDGYGTPGNYSSTLSTPRTHRSNSPAKTPMDRMTIESITNPQLGDYRCTYPGCLAQPFATQYLLYSHANVHGSIRPHYCSIKGCPRSEGGKGFKRKSDMIKHGREHKYPRPDNLQR